MNIGIWQIVIVTIFTLVFLRFFKRTITKENAIESETLQPSGDPTRYALASLYLKGSKFRQNLLELDEHPTRAMAPELGLDYKLVMAACRSIHKSEFIIELIVSILAVIFIISFFNVSAFGGPSYGALILFFYPDFTALHLSFICLVFVSLFKMWRIQFSKITPFKRENYNHELMQRKYLNQDGTNQKNGFPEDGNVIYFGKTNPFIGTGMRLNGWQITTKLVAENNSQTVSSSFNSQLFHNKISRTISELNLKTCRQKDILFINGTEIGQLSKEDQLYEKLFLPSPFRTPRMHIPTKAFPMLRQRNDKRLRAYTEYVMSGWQGEIIMSNFVRVEVEGSILTVEVVPVFLPPIARAFRTIDSIRNNGFLDVVKWIIFSVLKMPFLWLSSISSIISKIADLKYIFSSREKLEAKEIKFNPAYNYGAVSGVRIMMASNKPHFYFQEADAKRSKNILERAVFDSVLDTLKKNGFSTKDFEQQSVTIMDNSVNINANGSVDISGAIGKSAKSFIQRNTNRVEN